jgi:exopolysaccharide biosynthesis polyprenyl glycosylphosphotransferase
MKKSEIIFGLLRIPIDFTMVMLGFLAGYTIRLQGDFIPSKYYQFNPEEFPPINEYTQLSATFAVMLVFIFAIFGLYKLKNTDRNLREIKNILIYALVWTLMLMSYFFVMRELFFSRLVLVFSVILSIVFIIFARSILNAIKTALLKKGVGQRNVLLLGGNKITKSLAKQLLKEPTYKIVGFLTRKSSQIDGLKKLGTIKDLAKIVRKYKVEELIQTNQTLSELEDHDILAFCQENHLEYRFVPNILAVERSNIEIEPIAGLPLIHLKPTSLDGWGKVYKRSFDILSSSLGLIILSPIFALTALAIKIDSKGPILFSKLDDGSPANRIGQRGKAFKFYKFRTMTANTHSQRYNQLAKQNIRSGGPLVKIKDDPRITKLGKFLRRYDIDEWPQLWNILKGDMSLVGPRPHLPEEVEKYEKHHRFLLTIKPGMTGISQTSGRSDLDFETEARLDTYYIKQWSPILDFKIILKTIIVILKGHSAE